MNHRLLPYIRSNTVRGILPVMLLLCMTVVTSAQKISGMINNYYPVREVSGCLITLRRPANTLNPGDRVLIIQMRGASSRVSNDALSGEIVDYGEAGNYELATVAEVNGRFVGLQASLSRAYDVIWDVQLVRVPRYGDVTIAGDVTAPPWSATEGGGVIALISTGTVTLDSAIDASGTGFEGEGRTVEAIPGCGATGYEYSANSAFAGDKGEGIATRSGSRGRGANGNGGGGGNLLHAGGGGGGNFARGGFGGYESSLCSPGGSPETRGYGGHPLMYSNEENRLFMGGGGGAGHDTQANASIGGRGGGIIIICAREIRGNGRAIRSDGASGSNNPGVGADGSGGGGGGGTVLLSATSYGGTISVSVRGGSGGNSIFTGEKVGPGGGGGGGLLWVTSTSLPANLVLEASGGAAGIHTEQAADRWGATEGSTGSALTGLLIPEGVNTAPPPAITVSGSRTFCRGERRFLSADFGYDYYVWTRDDIPIAIARTATATQSGVYRLVVRVDSCYRTNTVSIVVTGPESNGGDLLLCRGDGGIIGENATAGTPPYRYSWSPVTGLSNPGIATPYADPEVTTEYVVTITDSDSCRFDDTIVVTVGNNPPADAGNDIDICPGVPTKIGTTPGGADAGYRYSWSPVAGLSDPASPTPIAAPETTTVYRLSVTDSTGCQSIDSMTLTLRAQVQGGVSDDTTICKRSSAYLSAAGGTGYSWRPATGLSCTSCPDPVASPSTTTRYIVTITQPGLCGRFDTVWVMIASESLRGDSTSVDFGTLTGCEISRDASVRLRNVGDEAITIDSARLTSPGFLLLSPEFPLTVVPGDSLLLQLRYQPRILAKTTGRLLLFGTQCDTAYAIDLSGETEKLLVRVEYPVVDFGSFLTCDSTSRDTSIRIINIGSEVIGIVGAQKPPAFQLDSFAVRSIDPGDTMVVVVSYSTVQVGKREGDLLFPFTAGGCDDAIHVRLRGRTLKVDYLASTDTIDFGDQIFCGNGDTTLSFTINNSNDEGVDGTVDSVRVTGPFATDALSGTQLPSGASQRFKVMFSPAADGDALGAIELVLAPCGFKKKIILRGKSRSVRIAGDTLIDIGPVDVGTAATGTGRYRNVGSIDLTIDHIDGLLPPFALASTIPSLPATLRPGEELEVIVRYVGTPGEGQIPIQLVADLPCPLKFNVIVRGRGESDAFSAISLGGHAAAPGERVTVPLMLDSSVGLDIVGATAFSATIRFNSVLLTPSGSTPAGLIDGKDRVITVTGIRSASAGPLATLEFIAALGDTIATPLALDSFSWNDGAVVVVETTDGNFTLEGLCVEGITRLIDADGNLSLKQSRPNPAGGATEIEFEIVERGRTRLLLRDGLGSSLSMLVDGDLSPGRYLLMLNVSQLPAGAYYYTLHTPTAQLSRMLIVIR